MHDFFKKHPICLEMSVFKDSKYQSDLFKAKKTTSFGMIRGQINTEEKFEGWVAWHNKSVNTFYLGNYLNGKFHGNGRLIDVENEAIKEGYFYEGIIARGKLLDLKKNEGKER